MVFESQILHHLVKTYWGLPIVVTNINLEEEQDKLCPLDRRNIEYWTAAYLGEQFFLNLTSIRCEIKILDDNGVTNKVIHYKKYYRQACAKMYRIPLTEQQPKSKQESVVFKIKFSDLSSTIQEQFMDYCRLYDKRYVSIFLKQVVLRLFENLDYDYAHLSVMKKLRVCIE